MKKKVLLIIIIVIALLAIAAGVIISVLNAKQYTRLFQDTDYPVCYKIKDGNIILTVKDNTKRTEAWEVSAEDPDYVAITPKGKVSAKKATYIISPASVGVTNVIFSKSIQGGKLKVDYVKLTFGTYVYETMEGLKCTFIDTGSLEYGKDIIGAGTDHPIILSPEADPSYDYMIDEVSSATNARNAAEEEKLMKGHIDFINGRGDWEVKSDTECVDVIYSGDSGREYINLSYIVGHEGGLIEDSVTEEDDNDPEKAPLATNTEPSWEGVAIFENMNQVVEVNTETDAKEMTGEAVLTFTSQSLGITEQRKVTFYKDGHVEFSAVNEK